MPEVITTEPTHYEVLGIEPNATFSHIRATYKKLVLKHHPDKNPNDPQATEKFNAIKNAFETLSDEKKRQIYDDDLQNAQNTDTVDIAEDVDDLTSDSSIVVKTTHKFLDLIARSMLSNLEIKKLFCENGDAALAIVNNKEYLKLIRNEELKTAVYNHAAVAVAVLKREELWPRLINDDLSLYWTARDHSQAFEIILQTPRLTEILSGQQLSKVVKKHRGVPEIKTALAENLSAQEKIQAYQTLITQYPKSNNIALTSTLFLLLEDLILKACPTATSLYYIFKKNELFGLVILNSDKLLELLTPEKLSHIAKESKLMAIELTKNEKLVRKLMSEENNNALFQSTETAIQLYDGEQNTTKNDEKYLRAVASWQPDFAAFVLSKPELYETLDGHSLHHLLDEHLKQRSIGSINRHDDNGKIQNIYLSDRRLREINSSYINLQHLDSNSEITLDQFNQLVIKAKMELSSVIMLACSKPFVARMVLANREMLKQVGVYFLGQFGACAENGASAIFEDEELWSRFKNQKFSLYYMAVRDPSVCRLIFSNPKLIQFFSGDHLFSLTKKAGNNIQEFITNPELMVKLRSYLLLKKAREQKDGLKIQKKSASAIKKEEQNETLYRMGLEYKKQSLVNNSTSNNNNQETITANLQLAEQCFIKAASMGHENALKEFIKLNEPTFNLSKYLQIAEIYLDPNHPAHNPQNAKLWLENVIVNLDNQTIPTILRHICESFNNLENNLHGEAIVNFYLEALEKIAIDPRFSTLARADHYRNFAKNFQEKLPSFALRCLECIPEQEHSQEELLLMADLTLCTMEENQFAEILIENPDACQEDIEKQLQSPQKTAERIVACLAYYFQGGERGLSLALRLLCQVFESDFPENELIDWVNNNEEIIKHFSSLLTKPEITHKFTDKFLLTICQNHTIILQNSALLHELIPYLKEPETFYQLAWAIVWANKSQFTSVASVYWKNAANQNHPMAKLIVNILDTTNQNTDDFLLKGLDLIVKQNSVDLLETHLGLLKAINALPTQYTVIRQQFLDALENNCSREQLFSIADEVQELTKIVESLQALLVKAEALPMQYTKIRLEISALQTQQVTDDEVIKFFSKEISAIEDTITQLQQTQKTIEAILPTHYIAIRQKVTEYLQKETYSMPSSLDSEINILQKMSQEMSVKQNALASAFTCLEQLRTNLQKNNETFKAHGDENEASKCQIRIRMVNTLEIALNQRMDQYYNQYDFSNPQIKRNDDHFKNTLINTINSFLTNNDDELKEEAAWYIQLAFTIINLLHKIFPDSPKVSQWMTNTSAHFKVAPAVSDMMTESVTRLLTPTPL